MKDFIEENIGLVLLAIILVLVVTSGLICSTVWNNTNLIEYNNGICKECGGHYHLVGDIIYECDTCYHAFRSLIVLH